MKKKNHKVCTVRLDLDLTAEDRIFKGFHTNDQNPGDVTNVTLDNPRGHSGSQLVCEEPTWRCDKEGAIFSILFQRLLLTSS